MRAPALAGLAMAYVAVLPLGQLFVLPVAGSMATATDLALLALVVAGVLAWVGRMASAGSEGQGWTRGDLGVGFALLVLFGAWVGASGLWGYHPSYAGAKGLGLVALGVGAYVLAVSGAGPARLADAWIVGAAAAVAVGVVFGVVGPPLLRERVLYAAGMVDGLPFPRLRGPLLHPNMFGDYLAVSGFLLWARWPAWAQGRRRVPGLAVAAALVVGLALTVSTGWLVAGAGLVALSFGARGWGAAGRTAAGAAGAALAAATAAGVLVPLRIPLGPLRIETGGIRPAIWIDAAAAALSAPFIGVGAAPYLAETPDPAAAGGVAFWDAHSAYLSVAAQFGLVGALLFFGGMGMLVRAAWRSGTAARTGERTAEPLPAPGAPAEADGALPASAAPAEPAAAPVEPAAEYRLRVALLAASAGILLHWTSVAGEDFRHLWALAGIAATVALSVPPGREPEGGPG